MEMKCPGERYGASFTHLKQLFWESLDHADRRVKL